MTENKQTQLGITMAGGIHKVKTVMKLHAERKEKNLNFQITIALVSELFRKKKITAALHSNKKQLLFGAESTPVSSLCY